MDIRALKRQGLGQKQLLERYLAIYDAFQKYVESLVPFVEGKPPEPSMIMAAENFRLLFNEYEIQFCEWEEGIQVINKGVAAFLNYPDEFQNNEPTFRMMLLLATAKFEDLLKKAGRDLRELHEQIALEEGQSKAEEVTRVPASALTKIKDADAVGEIASKSIGRAIQFAPWAYHVLKGLSGS